MGLFDKLKSRKAVTPEERKLKNIEFLKKMGIDYIDWLPAISSSSEVELKDLYAICKRAVACLLSTQLACDITDECNYMESRSLFLGLLKQYGVEDKLLPKENGLFYNNYDKQDVIDVVWEYECYWALIWALGMISDDEFKQPHSVCDCKKAITLVGNCNSFNEFSRKAKLRDKEEILDMLDLYYRYHWACDHKQADADTNIGNLNPEVVLERRRGLEWLISEEHDWHEIELNT